MATLVAATACSCLVGCGDDGPALYPASGAVTFEDGMTVSNAVVEFVPVDGGPAARGRTDEDGRFTLTTGGRPGAVAGRHRIGVVQVRMMDGLADHLDHMKYVRTVPASYAAPSKSGLTDTVTADGENDLSIVLMPDDN